MKKDVTENQVNFWLPQNLKYLRFLLYNYINEKIQSFEKDGSFLNLQFEKIIKKIFLRCVLFTFIIF